MATSTIIKTNIANMALRIVGDEALTTAEITANVVRRAQIINEFFETVRDATLHEHPWNCATKRATLYSYTTPASTLDPASGADTAGNTGVEFVSSPAAFASTDVGRQLVHTGGTGKATITAFNTTSSVAATIDQAFSTVDAIASGSWRFYYAYPAWGASKSIAVPSDCLRVYRTENNEEYQVEGGFIVLSQDVLNCRYTRQEDDYTKYPFHLVLAFASHLAAIICEPITGSGAKAEGLMKKYQNQLLRSKAMDEQEGTAEVLESNALTDVR
jgi:hypothetical protein